MNRFAAAGVECHAVSLRGTSGTPAPDGQKSVQITEHVADLRAFIDKVLVDESGNARPPPLLVGHSFGGSSVLKYLEAEHAASGAVFLCSVPPSGNTAMVARFLRRSLRQAWLITKGFAMKAAATDATVCRDLFFDEQTSLEDVATHEYPALDKSTAIDRIFSRWRRKWPDQIKHRSDQRQQQRARAGILPRPSQQYSCMRPCKISVDPKPAGLLYYAWPFPPCGPAVSSQ